MEAGDSEASHSAQPSPALQLSTALYDPEQQLRSASTPRDTRCSRPPNGSTLRTDTRIRTGITDQHTQSSSARPYIQHRWHFCPSARATETPQPERVSVLGRKVSAAASRTMFSDPQSSTCCSRSPGRAGHSACMWRACLGREEHESQVVDPVGRDVRVRQCGVSVQRGQILPQSRVSSVNKHLFSRTGDTGWRRLDESTEPCRPHWRRCASAASQSPSICSRHLAQV
jgi:hypothetical protein